MNVTVVGISFTKKPDSWEKLATFLVCFMINS